MEHLFDEKKEKIGSREGESPKLLLFLVSFTDSLQ